MLYFGSLTSPLASKAISPTTALKVFACSTGTSALQPGGARLLGRRGEDLEGRHGVERVPLGIEALRAQVRHGLLGGGVLARVRGEGEQESVGGRAGDLAQLVGGVGVARHELGGKALVTRLTQDQPDLGMVAADIDQIGLGLLEAGDQRRVVLLAGVVRFAPSLG